MGEMTTAAARRFASLWCATPLDTIFPGNQIAASLITTNSALALRRPVLALVTSHAFL